MSATHPTAIFPSPGHRTLSALVHLLGCSLLAGCFCRRFSVSSMSLAKFCILAIFADSWLFVFAAGLVVHGVGSEVNLHACLSGIYLCIFFYASSKILIYIFLAEKVRIVWGAGKLVGRLNSRVWLVCCLVLLGYLAIFILMLIARIGYFRKDGACVIGLRTIATIPLLTYDVFLNLFLTSLFVWPLLRRQLSNDKLRQLATRTCWAATVALTTSVINILILTLLHGQQLGWVCLASCGFDVTINAIVIFAVSHRADGSLQTEAESPRAPISSDKYVIASPRVAVFKGKKGTPNPNDSSIKAHTFSADFALTRAEESDMSIASFAAARPLNKAEMFDYLPKDQMPTMESDETVITPTSEKSEGSLYMADNRESSGSTIQQCVPSHVQGSSRSSFVSHERGRSRGLLAEFYDKVARNRNATEDVAIQITVTTEHTPISDSPVARANNHTQKYFVSSEDVAKAV